MPEEFYDKEFPNLKRETWVKTSDPANYNCIALVAGDETRYWWPNLWYPDPTDSFWPIDRHDLTVETFIEALATRGFSLSTKDDGRLEFGIQKAAIYALNKEVKHGALQQTNGKWRSKLGPHEDIETTLNGLAGPEYGSVVAFLRKSNEDFHYSPRRGNLCRYVCQLIRSLLAPLFRVNHN